MVCHAGIAADNSPLEDQRLQRGTLLSNSWALFWLSKAACYRPVQYICDSPLNFWKLLLKAFLVAMQKGDSRCDAAWEEKGNNS